MITKNPEPRVAVTMTCKRKFYVMEDGGHGETINTRIVIDTKSFEADLDWLYEIITQEVQK